MLIMRLAVVLGEEGRQRVGLGNTVPVWKLDARVPQDIEKLIQNPETGKVPWQVKHVPWMLSDEPMLNGRLWEVGGNKTWCKLDVDIGAWATGRTLAKDMWFDKKWF